MSKTRGINKAPAYKKLTFQCGGWRREADSKQLNKIFES